MAPNGDRFEAAYNKIDALLRKKVSRDRSSAFSSIVMEAAKKDATVRAYKDDLLEYGDLRNAIVHDRGRTPFLLADPREEIVIRIEEILSRLSRPRKLRSLARPIPLRIFKPTELLPDALSYLRTNDFSQVVALRAEMHVILSAEGVAHWLEDKSKSDIIALSEVSVGDALDFEPEGSCVYLKADDTVEHAREIFANDIGKRVFSALVTESGSPKQTPLNIVTPWDFVAGALR
jgi:hypothetical protein